MDGQRGSRVVVEPLKNRTKALNYRNRTKRSHSESKKQPILTKRTNNNTWQRSLRDVEKNIQCIIQEWDNTKRLMKMHNIANTQKTGQKSYENYGRIAIQTAPGKLYE